MTGFQFLTSSVQAGFQGDTDTVMLADPRDAQAVILVPREDMDRLCAEWMAHSMTADQFDTVMRVLRAVAQTPRGRAYGVHIS